MAYEDRVRAGLPSQRARRSRLARWLRQRPARDDAATTDLDDEWAGTCYAQSRRLLDAALKR